MKQTILDHINNETFSEWYLEAQVYKNIEPDDLVHHVEELVEEGSINKPDIIKQGSYYVISWAI